MYFNALYWKSVLRYYVRFSQIRSQMLIIWSTLLYPNISTWSSYLHYYITTQSHIPTSSSDSELAELLSSSSSESDMSCTSSYTYHVTFIPWLVNTWHTSSSSSSSSLPDNLLTPDERNDSKWWTQKTCKQTNSPKPPGWSIKQFTSRQSLACHFLHIMVVVRAISLCR